MCICLALGIILIHGHIGAMFTIRPYLCVHASYDKHNFLLKIVTNENGTITLTMIHCEGTDIGIKLLP